MVDRDGYWLVLIAAAMAFAIFSNWRSGSALTGGPPFWKMGEVPRSENPVHFWAIQVALAAICIVCLVAGLHLLDN